MEIEYSKQAVKTLNKLDVPTKRRIRAAIHGIPEGDIVPLKGFDGSYRLRMGDWRILFSYLENGTLLVERIAPRGDAYKGV